LDNSPLLTQGEEQLR